MFNMDCLIFPPPGEKSPAECKRLHYGGKPPPRPPPLGYSCLCPPADDSWNFPAVGFAVRSAKRGVPPRRKITAKEIGIKKRIRKKMMKNPGRYKLHQYLKYAHQWASSIA